MIGPRITGTTKPSGNETAIPMLIRVRRLMVLPSVALFTTGIRARPALRRFDNEVSHGIIHPGLFQFLAPLKQISHVHRNRNIKMRYASRALQHPAGDNLAHGAKRARFFRNRRLNFRHSIRPSVSASTSNTFIFSRKANSRAAGVGAACGTRWFRDKPARPFPSHAPDDGTAAGSGVSFNNRRARRESAPLWLGPEARPV